MFFLSFFLSAIFYEILEWRSVYKVIIWFLCGKGMFFIWEFSQKKKKSCKIIIITVLENKNGMESNPGSGGRWRGMFDTEEAFYFKKNSFVMCKKKKIIIWIHEKNDQIFFDNILCFLLWWFGAQKLHFEHLKLLFITL